MYTYLKCCLWSSLHSIVHFFLFLTTFFRIQLSLTLVVHQSCFYFCSILFPNHTWELVFMWTVVGFFFGVFTCLFVCLIWADTQKIDRKLILKFCFDWTWCQHTIWICRLIWKFYSWERKSDLLLGFSANSFVLSFLITKSAMHQWLPRNSI